MDKEITNKLQEILHKCQAWVDNEKYIPKNFRTKSWSDEFAENIMSALEDEMIKQKFGLQNEKIYLPTKYFVEISREDSFEFVGKKRELLNEALNRFVGNCFRLLSIDTNLKDFVQIQTSAELQKGEIKIIHQWEESYSPNILFNQRLQTTRFEGFNEDTIIAPAFWENNFESSEKDNETVVKKRFDCLFCVEIWYNGFRENNLPVFQPEIIIGRGSPSLPADIILKDDDEISRHHARLSYKANNSFNLTVFGQNPTLVKGEFLFAGQTVALTWEEDFQIGGYVLRIQR